MTAIICRRIRTRLGRSHRDLRPRIHEGEGVTQQTMARNFASRRGSRAAFDPNPRRVQTATSMSMSEMTDRPALIYASLVKGEALRSNAVPTASTHSNSLRIGIWIEPGGSNELHCRAAFFASNRCIFLIIAFLFFLITLPGTFLIPMIFAFWQVNDPPSLLQSRSCSISPSGFTT